MSLNLNACPNCKNTQTIHIHQIGKFFAKCHYCGHQAAPHETQIGAAANWNGVEYKNSPLEDAIITVKLMRGSDQMLSDEFLKALDVILNEVTK